MPRHRPPYPVERGLWGRPTLVNNVETLANIPWIIRHGAERFARLGRGTIVGIGSVAGDRGRCANPVYNTSKAGLHTFLEALRNRVDRDGDGFISKTEDQQVRARFAEMRQRANQRPRQAPKPPAGVKVLKECLGNLLVPENRRVDVVY